MADLDLDRLQTLAENATPGPWRLEEDGNEGMPWVFPHGAYCPDRATTEFIAAWNPETALALLARLKDTERERDEARAELARASNVRAVQRPIYVNTTSELWAAIARHGRDRQIARAEAAEARAERAEQALLQLSDYNEGEPCWCPPQWWERRDESGVHSKTCDIARAALAASAPAPGQPPEEPA